LVDARVRLDAERDKADQRSARWLAAESWLARAAFFAKRWDAAERHADRVLQGVESLLLTASVDSDSDLATAAGAAIEVKGHALANQNQHAGAIGFLRAQRCRFVGTSIETRIQKNLLLIDLEGKPMPPLEADRFIGPELPIDIEGKVALFYFWAHWCSDCKAQKPALLALHRQYSDRGLRIIGPTRLFGYAAGGEDARPQQEIAYIEGPWQQTYPLPAWMPKPLSEANFVNFGVSTTPTLVLVDRQGVVRLYHPGGMSFDELEAALKPLL
jgi:thiol-disulfide isomerase/thioredoxin